MTVRIRDALPADVSAIAAIERGTFSDPWSEGMLRAHLRGAANAFIVAEDGGAVVGFAIALTAAGESELLDIAVGADVRGHGVGSALLESICARCAVSGARSMTLEVRESNIAARALYARYGFVQVGVRRRYYRTPDEDGLLLRAEIPIVAGRSAVPR